MLRRLGAVLLLLTAACARPPVAEDVSIEIEANDRVRVESQTTFNDADAKTPAALAKIDAARFAAQHGTDGWSARFARVTAEDESLTVEKHRGKISRVMRVVRIPTSDLQNVFADTNITVNLLNGEGWRELAFYPGGSMRATREQRQHFESALTSWSAAAARYYTAIDRLYFYLNANPRRAPDLFADLLGESDGITGPAVLEEEAPLVDAVKDAMEEIATRMDQQQDDAATFAEEADLIYNPFPARMTVRVPGEVVSSAGFTKDLVIEPVNLFEAIKALEGRWISPDPLAGLLRDDEVKSSIMAWQPRRSTQVLSAADVANALREQLQRPESYQVRWR
ncbi:MAG TPA: hypothetical protein VEK79_23560 [Thermoanaerobaculia bacterium]|nr:hypothetical protein [Thermoanaerobaculia bacterium]